jgi:hypothetical protein
MGPRSSYECPERLDSEDWLLVTVWPMLQISVKLLAAITDVELAHDRMMVAAIRGLSDQLGDIRRPSCRRLTPDTSLNAHLHPLCSACGGRGAWPRRTV